MKTTGFSFLKYFLQCLFTFCSTQALTSSLTIDYYEGETYSIPSFHEVTKNILRGGRPASSDINNLKNNGVNTIINIENDNQTIEREKKQAEKLGLRFISSPMEWQTAPSDQQIDTLLENLSNPENGQIFIHCKHGHDRTGLVIGLYRVLVQSWKPQDAYDEMQDLNFHPQFKALDSYFKKRTGWYE